MEEKAVNSRTESMPLVNATSIGFGLVAVLLLFVTLTGRKIPIFTEERFAVMILVLIGMAACANGIGRVAAEGAWLHPLAILGYLLGAVILVIGVSALFGFKMPLIVDSRQAIVVTALLGTGKLLVSVVHRLF